MTCVAAGELTPRKGLRQVLCNFSADVIQNVQYVVKHIPTALQLTAYGSMYTKAAT